MGFIVSAKNKKIRLDEYLVRRQLVASRHQAADLIKRKQVKFNQTFIDKPAFMVDVSLNPRIHLKVNPPYVTRGGDKLAGVSQILNLNFQDKIILDVGAHRGGFTDYMTRQGARLIATVDVGQQALDASLNKEHIISFTKTDIRNFKWPAQLDLPDMITLDLSFISLTKILNNLLVFCHPKTQILALVKPQFEAGGHDLKNGIVRRSQRQVILNVFETWLKENNWRIKAKADASLKGSKGNLERFYLL